MEFYRNDFGEEMQKDQFMSLQSLMKYNDGLWKSEKQGKFILSKWTLKEIGEFHWVGKWIGEKEGHKYIVVDGFTQFDHGHGRGHVPITYCYEVDHAGIVARYRGRFWRDGDSAGLKSVDKDWERTVPTPVAPKAPETAPVEEKKAPVSEWFGEVGKRYNDMKLTVKFVTGFDTQFGYSYVNKMEDDKGNVFVWFSSRGLEEGQTYLMNVGIKEHSEYREVKQTVLTRCLKVREVA
jgi:hypothetical protein